MTVPTVLTGWGDKSVRKRKEWEEGEGLGDEMAPEGGQTCSAKVCTQKADHLHTKCMSIPAHERVRVPVRVGRVRGAGCPV